MIPEPLIFIGLGAMVGVAVGLTGIGGGSLMTPLLLLMGIPVPTAIGTDLCYAAITKFSGMIAHHRNNNVNWRIVCSMALGSIPGSVCAIMLLEYTAHQHTLYTEILTYSIGWMLILTSLSIFLHHRLKIRHLSNGEPKAYDLSPKLLSSYASCIVIGFIIGILVTLSSVGAGAIGTAALLFLFPAMLPVRVIGTEIAHAVPLTIIASIGHLYLGNIDFKLLLFLITGSIPGVFISAHLINKLPINLLRYLLATILLLFGIRYLTG